MTFKLEPEQYEELRKLQKRVDLSRRKDHRVNVLVTLRKGASVSMIEDVLAIDNNPIYRYAGGFLKVDLETYLSDDYTLLSGRLTDEQEKGLAAHLEEYLYPDAKSICAYVKKRFGVEYSVAVNGPKPEHLVHDLADSVNARSTQRLWRILLRKHPGRTVFLICDHARFNHKKMLKEWAKDQRIEFVYLPTSSTINPNHPARWR